MYSYVPSFFNKWFNKTYYWSNFKSIGFHRLGKLSFRKLQHIESSVAENVFTLISNHYNSKLPSNKKQKVTEEVEEKTVFSDFEDLSDTDLDIL